VGVSVSHLISRIGLAFFDTRELVTNIRSNIFDVVDTIVFQINACLCDENCLSLSGLIIGGNLGKPRDCLGLFGVSIDVIGYPFTCPRLRPGEAKIFDDKYSAARVCHLAVLHTPHLRRCDPSAAPKGRRAVG